MTALMIPLAAFGAVICLVLCVAHSFESRKDSDSSEFDPKWWLGGLGVALLAALASVPLALFVAVGSLIAYFVHQQQLEKRRQQSELESAFEMLCDKLKESPLSEDTHHDILCVSQGQPKFAHPAYQLALTVLAENPESLAARQFALASGRASYSVERPDGKPTIYDEQAIQNDILIRTGGAKQQEPVAVTLS